MLEQTVTTASPGAVGAEDADGYAPLRSRRAIIAAAMGAVAAAGLGILGRPTTTRAAAGEPIVAGQVNNSGNAGTTIFAETPETAVLTTLNFGTGDSIHAVVTDPEHDAVAAFSSVPIAGGGVALRGEGGQNTGVAGTSSGPDRFGVTGTHVGTNGVGVEGQSTVSGGRGVGVRGRAAGDTGVGVLGEASHRSGASTGVRGEVDSSAGTGVAGIASSDSGPTRGVLGESASDSGFGVLGRATNEDFVEPGAIGVRGESVAYAGVWGESSASDGLGVVGHVHATGNSDPAGVYGDTPARSGAGVEGWARATSGTAYGVYGTTSSSAGVAVRGTNTAESGNTYGVYGEVGSNAGFALFGLGNARVTGGVTAHQEVSGAAGKYRIDNPTDASDRILQHGFVGSDQWKNLYDGTVICDGSGEAVVDLPGWFSRLNRDMRIQLTSSDFFSPLYVAEVNALRSFKIAGGAPDQAVYWQVTGVRKDNWAKAHPLRVEENKRGKEAGRLLHPEERNANVSRGVTEAYRLKRRRRRVR